MSLPSFSNLRLRAHKQESEHIGLLLSYLNVPETQSLCEINMDERTNMKRILCKNLELIRTRV